jgi:hypothetical protein
VKRLVKEMCVMSGSGCPGRSVSLMVTSSASRGGGGLSRVHSSQAGGRHERGQCSNAPQLQQNSSGPSFRLWHSGMISLPGGVDSPGEF